MNVYGSYLLAGVLAAAGVVLMVIGIRGLARWMAEFRSAPVFEMSCAEVARTFRLPTDGVYDIWIKSPRFKVNPLIDRGPRVRSVKGGTTLPLTPSIFRTHVTRGSTVAMAVASFTAPGGDYVLELVPPADSGIRAGLGGIAPSLERSLTRRIFRSAPNPADSHLQIRPRGRPAGAWVFKGILPILFGALLLTAGITLGVIRAASAHGDSPDCDPVLLKELAASLAASANGTLGQLEDELGVSADPLVDPTAVGGQEFLAQPVAGSRYATLIERVQVRLDSGADTFAAVVITARPAACRSMDSVVEQFGPAVNAAVPPHEPGKGMTLTYGVDGRNVVFGFGPAPGYPLISVSLGQAGTG